MCGALRGISTQRFVSGTTWPVCLFTLSFHFPSFLWRAVRLPHFDSRGPHGSGEGCCHDPFGLHAAGQYNWPQANKQTNKQYLTGLATATECPRPTSPILVPNILMNGPCRPGSNHATHWAEAASEPWLTCLVAPARFVCLALLLRAACLAMLCHAMPVPPCAARLARPRPALCPMLPCATLCCLATA